MEGNKGVPIAVRIQQSSSHDARRSSPENMMERHHRSRSAYDRMSSRIREFEEDCKRWRERLFNESKFGQRPSSAMMRERPQLALESSDFPDFPATWSDDNSYKFKETNKESMPYQTYLEEDLDGNKILKIKLDVGDFTANELNVAIDRDMLVVKGERDVVHGNTSRTETFSKELSIPGFADKNGLKSSLTSDGHLIFESPVYSDRLSSVGLKTFLSQPFTSHSKSRTESRSGYTSTSSSVSRSRPPLNERTGSTALPVAQQSRESAVSGTSGSKAHTTSSTQIESARMPGKLSEGPIRRDDHLVYKFDLAGFNLDDLNIQVEKGMVLITAQQQEHDTVGRTYKKYQKEIHVPNNADTTKISNRFSDDGVLTVQIPLLESSQGLGDAATARTISTLGGGAGRAHDGREQISRYTDDNRTLKLSYDLSGYRTDNIQVQVTGNTLSINAPRMHANQSDYSQRSHLPSWADGNNARANINKDGMLTIEIPRKR